MQVEHSINGVLKTCASSLGGVFVCDL